ncbi:unnamed protein product [Amoebophrya sp. A120]|nr:unnamed protein product [Amoebophrya sp. A120]|eukprot:GSA120T00003334001.1
MVSFRSVSFHVWQLFVSIRCLQGTSSSFSTSNENSKSKDNHEVPALSFSSNGRAGQQVPDQPAGAASTLPASLLREQEDSDSRAQTTVGPQALPDVVEAGATTQLSGGNPGTASQDDASPAVSKSAAGTYTVWGTPTKAEKHAIELDLECSSYQDYDWLHVKRQLWWFFDDIEVQSHNMTLIHEILYLAKSKPQTDCYIGLFCLGLFTFLFMEPENRAKSVVLSTFLSGDYARAIPLTFWDTIAAGWPVFTMLDVLAQTFSQDYRVDQVRLDPFWDFEQESRGPAFEYEKMRQVHATFSAEVKNKPADGMGSAGQKHKNVASSTTASQRQTLAARLAQVYPRVSDVNLSLPDNSSREKDKDAGGNYSAATTTQSSWVPTIEWVRRYCVQVADESRIAPAESSDSSGVVRALDALLSFDRYGAAASYFILAEKVLRRMRAILSDSVDARRRTASTEAGGGEKNHDDSSLGDPAAAPTADEQRLSSVVAFKNRKFVRRLTRSKQEDSSYDLAERQLFETDLKYRQLVTEARGLLLLGEMALEWPQQGMSRVLYDRTLISADFWPLWKLVANVERTGAVTRNYNKMLPLQRIQNLRTMQERSGEVGVSTKAEKTSSPDHGSEVEMKPAPEDATAISAPLQHVAFSGNKEQVPGMVASFESLVRNAKNPEKLVIHFFLAREEVPIFLNVLACSFKEVFHVLLPSKQSGALTGVSSSDRSPEGNRSSSTVTGVVDERQHYTSTSLPSAEQKYQPVGASENDAVSLRSLLLEHGALGSVSTTPSNSTDSTSGASTAPAAPRTNDFLDVVDMKVLTTFLKDYARVTEVLTAFATFVLHGTARLKLHLFNATDLSEYVSDDAHSSNHGNLTAPHNYIRFSLARRLEKVHLMGIVQQQQQQQQAVPAFKITTWSVAVVHQVDVVLYLDLDLIVAGDVGSLFAELQRANFLKSFPIAAVPRPNPLSTFLYNWDQQKAGQWQPIFSTPSFNAGVMVFNLQMWRSEKLEEKLRDHVFRPALRLGRFWKLGSQPPLLAWFLDSFSNPTSRNYYEAGVSKSTTSRSRNVLFLSPEWNVEGLGHHCQSSFYDKAQCLTEMQKKVKSGKILHWTGPNKPWIYVDEKDDFNSKFLISDVLEPNKDGDANADHDTYKKIWQKYARHCWY